MSSTALTLTEQADHLLPSPEVIDRYKQQASLMIHSGLVPNGISKPEQLIVLMLKGRELGLSPQRALAGIHVINGRAGMGGELMLGLIYERLPKARITIIEQTAKQCIIEATRDIDHEKPQRFSFTSEEASAAKYDQSWDKEKSGWKPKATWGDRANMLRWRCISRMARFMFPDILGGVSYTPDELQDMADKPVGQAESPEAKAAGAVPYATRKSQEAQPPVVVEAEVLTPEPAPEPPKAPAPSPEPEPEVPSAEPSPAMGLFEAISEAKTVGEVSALVAEASKTQMSDEDRQYIADAANDALKRLKPPAPTPAPAPIEAPKPAYVPGKVVATVADLKAALEAGVDPDRVYKEFRANCKGGDTELVEGFKAKQAFLKNKK
jgi:hypothetical protein